MLARLLSLFLVLAYVTGAGVIAGPLSALRMLALVVVPLACVWFPEALGEFTGHSYTLTKRSPASLVWFLGWVVLVLPLIIATLLWLQGVRLDGSLL
jgi:hypothetical protein